MNTLDALVEMQMKESELRVRHVDELLQRARTVPASAATSIDDRLLARVEADRNALLGALDSMKHAAPGEHAVALEAGRRLHTALEVVGSELEKALAAVVSGRG